MRWRSATSGPICVDSSSGSPTVSAPTAARERVDDLVVAVARHEDAALRAADLAVVHQAGLHELVEHRVVELDVVEHDRRRLAAELEGAALELRAAQLADAHPGRGRTGEADLVDPRVLHEVLTGLAAGGHDVDDTFGHAGFDRGLGEQVAVERRLGRGLQHDGAAGEHRGAELRARR